MANWVIDPSKNEGYPSLTVWPPEWQTDYTSSDTIRYPDYMWRIKAGVNDDYPWIYPWFKVDTSDSGDMEIGGAQTNYPNGFTYADDGGVRDTFNDDDMTYNDALVTYINGIFQSALSDKMWALDSVGIGGVVHGLNSPSLWDAATIALLGTVFGANIYDSIISCRMYPFQLRAFPTPESNPRPKAYSLFELVPETWTSGIYRPGLEAIQTFDMGRVGLPVEQAWELENISWYIYLPYAGVFPVDIRDSKGLSLRLTVDILTGVGEYSLKQNRQVTNTWKCQMGFDFPLRTTEGQVLANMYGSVANAVAPIIPVAGAALGAASVGAEAEAAAVKAAASKGQMIGSSASTLLKADKMQVSAPQVGGLTSNYCYPRARLIARIPKMFNGGYGYRETQGDNRSTTYVQLKTCSGFTKCENYKTDIIVATTPEKQEIENLMNAGVFL